MSTQTENRIVTEEAKKLLKIGEVFATTRNTVTDKWVNQYCIALRDGNPLWLDDAYAEREGRWGYRPAPSAFFTNLNPTERGEVKGWGSEYFEKLRKDSGWRGGGGGFAAFSEVEYFKKPIRVGDTITCEVSMADSYEKESRGGAIMVFIVVDYVMFNQDGDKIAKASAGWIRRFTEPKSDQN